MLDPRRPIDHGRGGARRERLGAIERQAAKVRIPDGIHHERVRRQRLIRIEVIRVNRMNGEAAIIDPQPGRNIAAEGRDQQDQRYPARATIALRDQRPAGESAPTVLLRPAEPELAEHPGHALVGLVQLGIEGERGLVLRARAGDVLVLAQQIAEIHAPDDVVGMMRDGLYIRRARRGSISARPGERPELVQRAEIARVLAQHLDVGLLGGIVLPRPAERASALEAVAMLGASSVTTHPASRHVGLP